jgi:hypothetical protein
LRGEQIVQFPDYPFLSLAFLSFAFFLAQDDKVGNSRTGAAGHDFVEKMGDRYNEYP